ncbi:T6SS protein Cts1W [Serratia sp. S1B]|nr:T6SS protein Cts1W [Serratia sp. S1B]
MKLQTYSIFEGSFQSVAPVIDRSVNVLMFRDSDHNEYNIMVNRVTLEEDLTLETYCEQQIEQLRNKLPGFQIEGKLLKHEIGPAKLPVVQIANQYLQDGNLVRQVQSLIQLPWHATANPQEREVIIFTLYAEGEFSEQQRKHYIQVINTFQPNTTVS